jgi:glyoxylase-like metal-dependent hydrolase (beta-lactamase superfamily II)
MSTSLFGLPISWTADWIFNSYVVDAGDELVAVDPGLVSVANQVVDMVRDDLGRDPSDISSVLCTHGHSDHVGGVSTLLGHCQADVHLPGRCQGYLQGERPRNFPLFSSSVRFLSVYSEQDFSVGAVRALAATANVGYGRQKDMTVDFEPAGFLADGDHVPHAEGWEVLSTPGHTDDSTCFYHADTATLISGDAVVSEDGTAWFNPEFIDIHQAAETAERLLDLEVRHLRPGHGKPIEASNVWARAKQPLDKPTGRSVLARCSRRFGRWS